MPDRLNEQLVFHRTTDSPTSGLESMLTLAQDASIESLKRVALFKQLLEYSALTGGHVRLDTELGCLPALIGSDARPIFLYEFVEALDGLVDYDSIKEEFPTLSYAQISGAIAFIRKVAQLNARGINIDELEDEADANDANLTNALRDALNSVETLRVLNNS